MIIQWIEANSGHQSDDCLIWPFSETRGGYGHCNLNGHRGAAHRYMCQLVHGDPPSAQHEAAHSCRNRKCVNPRHLRWATPKENSADKIKDGTLLFGESAPSSFLSEREVRAIRRLTADGVAQRRIAEAFEVTPQRVNEIVRGKAWKYAGGPTH